MVKCLSTMRETQVWALGWEDPLEKEMAVHSSTIAWKIPWTEEPGRLQSMGWQRVGHHWATSLLQLYKVSVMKNTTCFYAEETELWDHSTTKKLSQPCNLNNRIQFPCSLDSSRGSIKGSQKPPLPSIIRYCLYMESKKLVLMNLFTKQK